MGLWIDPEKRLEYVLERERDLPAPKRTVYVLRALTAREAAQAKDAVSRKGADGEYEMGSYEFDVEILTLALVEARGPGVPKVEPDELVNRMPSDVLGEVALAAWNMTTVGEDEGKG